MYPNDYATELRTGENSDFQDFEKFLEEKCFEENPQVLDDDMSDFFDNWIAQLDAEEFIKYGNQFKKK